MKYQITTPREKYFLDEDNVNELRKAILKKEKIQYVEYEQPKARFIFLEQDDPRWGKVRIGNTPYELEDYGCLIANLSMLSYWYGKYFSPDQIAKKASFTSDGSYIWKSGDSFLPFKFVYRYYARDIEKIKSILFSEDNACVVRVFWDKYKKSYHWLTVIGYDQKSGKLIGADPINGQRVYIEDRYGTINGFAEVARA